MIKFIDMASEHKELPNTLVDSSEATDRNRKNRSYVQSENPYDKYSYNIYCTYALISTDEINTDNFYIAVMDSKPKYSRRTKFVFEEPIWTFIENERTEEQQKFISKNIDRLNELFIEFAQKNGYL